MQPAYTIIRGLEEFTRLRCGLGMCDRTSKSLLSHPRSRGEIPFAATVLRSGTTRRYRSRVPSLNDFTPSI